MLVRWDQGESLFEVGLVVRLLVMMMIILVVVNNVAWSIED